MICGRPLAGICAPEHGRPTAISPRRDSELYAADRGYVNMWKVAVIDPRAGGKPALLTMDGAKHATQRGVMSKAFTPGVVKRLEDKFRGYAVAIVDAALQKGTFNFAKAKRDYAPSVLGGRILGKRGEPRA